jgi:WD40-like Beta Propeller Repeat
MITKRYLWLLFLVLGSIQPAFAQIMQTPFGKNRVQYNRQIDEWSVYETANFVTYWYGDARNVAHATVQIAESDYLNIQQLLEHQMNTKIEILVFSDLTDIKQSNLGENAQLQNRSARNGGQVGSVILKNPDAPIKKNKPLRWKPTLWQHVHNNPVFGARTKSAYEQVSNKVLVYFNGNHADLRAQIREGVAAVMVNSMLYGANLQEVVQNSVLLNLPDWYIEGLTSYCGREWSEDWDNSFREIILSGRYKTFDKLVKEHPRLAGHAFWYYISLHFGRSTVSNLMYLTRINRGLDAGFLYMLGSGYKRTGEAVMEYFKSRYRHEVQFMKMPPGEGALKLNNKPDLSVTQVKISPDGKRIAWVTNDLGRWRIWMRGLDKNAKRQLLMKGGTRSPMEATDYNYPLIAWHPDNQQIAILSEQRDRAYLTQLNPKTRKKTINVLAPDYQRVYSMDFVNSNDILFSAAIKGFSDLMIYKTRTKQTERITQDFWDDLDASVTRLNGRPGIMWTSNRTIDSLLPARLDTILPIGHYDIFFYDLETRDPELIRISNTPDVDERAVLSVDSTHYVFLSDVNGISNRQAGRLEEYTAYYKTIFYLKDGGEIPALDMNQTGEWPLEKALKLFAPADTVRKNLDSTKIDSVRSFPILKKRARTWNQTNYDRSIGAQHLSARTGTMVEMVRHRGRSQVYVRKEAVLSPDNVPTGYTHFRENALMAAGFKVPPPPVIDTQKVIVPPTVKLDTVADARTKIDTVPIGWQFQLPEYLLHNDPPAPPAEETAETPENNAIEIIPPPVVDTIPDPRPRRVTLEEMMASTKPLVEFGKPGPVLRFNPARITSYRLRFRTNHFSTNFDNNLLFEGLDSYLGPNNFNTPPPGLLAKANFKDLLDDYTVEFGARLPTTFNGMEYYAWFDNKKRRLDRRIALYRKTTVSTEEPIPQRVEPLQVRTNTILGQYEVRYPFDAFFSVRAMGSLRQDRAVTLSTNQPTLEAPDRAEQRAAIRLSAVYDNTVDVDLNIKTGTRAKIWVEAVKRFELNTQPRLDLRLNSGFMTVLSMDARHYLPIDRRSIFATRLAGSTSFGSERILYFLGGVDNWVLPKFNNNIPSPQDDNFAFQTLAAHLRGFKQNIRNGNSYVLFNSELRVPIFKYMSRKPVLGNFWRNFQIIGFFDAGTAWQGRSPYRGDNPLNTVVIRDPRSPIIVRVNYFRDPLVAGYGVGARMQLFGMFLRADYGWGIETRVVQKPMLHLALGTDF